jgi:hypothetical protein
VEDVGNAKGKCKNYAKHSSPESGHELLAGGHPIGQDVYAALIHQACRLRCFGGTLYRRVWVGLPLAVYA